MISNRCHTRHQVRHLAAPVFRACQADPLYYSPKATQGGYIPSRPHSSEQGGTKIFQAGRACRLACRIAGPLTCNAASTPDVRKVATCCLAQSLPHGLNRKLAMLMWRTATTCGKAPCRTEICASRRKTSATLALERRSCNTIAGMSEVLRRSWSQTARRSCRRW